MEWIVEGLKDLRLQLIAKSEIRSVAIPLVGAGLGGLEKAEVLNTICVELSLMDTKIYISYPE